MENTMLHKKYRKMTEPHAGHMYSVHSRAHGNSRKVHQWLLCRDSDVFDRRMVDEPELNDASKWQWME
jgi:hypothetical protein